MSEPGPTEPTPASVVTTTEWGRSTVWVSDGGVGDLFPLLDEDDLG